MPENPLLPHAELRALHALLRQAAKAAAAEARKKTNPGTHHRRASMVPPRSREALLAATVQQLRPGDLLLAEAGDTVPATLLLNAISAPAAPAGMPHLTMAAAMAAALPTASPRPLVLALCSSALAEPFWERALAWAQADRLPLILACADPSGAEALRVSRNPRVRRKPGASEGLGWTTLSKVAHRLKLPVLTVDGEDAVAVYRVTQESVLRARSGDGPAVLWAVLPSPRELAAPRPPAATPLRRLERFLRTRKVELTVASAIHS